MGDTQHNSRNIRRTTHSGPPRRVAETLVIHHHQVFLFRFAAAMHACLGIIHLRSSSANPPCCLSLSRSPPHLSSVSFPSLPSKLLARFLSDADAQKPCPREPWKGPARGRVNRVWRRPGSLVCVGPMRKEHGSDRGNSEHRSEQTHAPSQCHAGMPCRGCHHLGILSGCESCSYMGCHR